VKTTTTMIVRKDASSDKLFGQIGCDDDVVHVEKRWALVQQVVHVLKRQTNAAHHSLTQQQTNSWNVVRKICAKIKPANTTLQVHITFSRVGKNLEGQGNMAHLPHQKSL